MHVNVGGGNSDQLEDHKKHLTDMEAMANITYAWMIDRVREYTDLVFNEDDLQEIAQRYSTAQNDLLAEDDTRRGGRAYQGWGMGPVADSWEGMKLGGSKVRSPGHYPEKGATHEYIHPVVAYAKRKDAPKHYDSAAMKGFERKPRTDPPAPGFNWVKEYEEGAHPMEWIIEKLEWLLGRPAWAKGSKVTVTIPEFVIPQDTPAFKYAERILLKESTVRYGTFEELGSKADRLNNERNLPFQETNNFLKQLDRDNGVEVP